MEYKARSRNNLNVASGFTSQLTGYNEFLVCSVLFISFGIILAKSAPYPQWDGKSAPTKVMMLGGWGLKEAWLITYVDVHVGGR